MTTLLELEAFIAKDQELSSLRSLVERRLSSDNSHDIWHALRVALWTVRLGGGGVDPREAVAAALCHDLVNIPKNSPDRAEASGISADLARSVLPDYGFDSEAVAMIAEAVRDHSYSRGASPSSLLGQALQDADRLEALGAIGIMRTVSTGVRIGASYFDPEDPWALRRALDDEKFSVDHFFTKLLVLRNGMCTLPGRAEATRRLHIMYSFLDALSTEIAVPRPGNHLPLEELGE